MFVSASVSEVGEKKKKEKEKRKNVENGYLQFNTFPDISFFRSLVHHKVASG